MTYLLVGAGGALGAMARHGLGTLLLRLFPAALFPLGTLVANVVGCFAIGVAAWRIASPNSQLWALAVTGFLGGFTTFSAFGGEHVQLAQRGAAGAMWLHVLCHIGLGLGAAWLGYALGRLR